VLEGIDCSGTTTQAELLAERLVREGHPAHHTAEPSAGRIGCIVREYLSGEVDVPDVERHYHSLALLFAADRLDHLAREIEPRLSRGEHVVSDRYVLSSYVYQSLHCEPSWVREINAEAPRPDLTFLLDVPVEIAMERLARRSLFRDDEIYETAEQQERIRQLYARTARDLYSNHDIVVIDGALPVEKVHEKIFSQLMPRLTAHVRAQSA